MKSSFKPRCKSVLSFFIISALVGSGLMLCALGDVPKAKVAEVTSKKPTKSIDDQSAKKTNYGKINLILGEDFITPEAVMNARKEVMYTDEQITVLAESMPSEDVFKWCLQYGYAVMPAPPKAMTLLEIHALKSEHFISRKGGWYMNQKFARDEKVSGWLIIKKTPVLNSTDKNWSEQSKLLSEFEQVPSVAEVSWFITTYFEVRGIRLYERVNVRTSSLDFGGDHVLIGVFNPEGIRIFPWPNDSSHHYNIGLVSSRKPKD